MQLQERLCGCWCGKVIGFLEKAAVFFDFVAANFMVVQAVPKDIVCTGRLCDAQGPSNNCGGFSGPSQKYWALSLTVQCDELLLQ